MTFVCSVQPGRARALLADSDGGTPQRFMWFPATDSRITRTNRRKFKDNPFSLKVPKPGEWQYDREIRIPDEAEAFIEEQYELRQQGHGAALDGHAIFAREKFAYALAVLDGRADMTSEDWELSGIAAKVSDATRDWVAQGMADAERRQAADAGRLTGERMHAASESKADAEIRTWNRVADKVVDKVGEAGPEGMTEAAAGRMFNSRDRKHITPSMFAALAAVEPHPRLVAMPRQPADKSDRWRVP
jgi:hypothetical protein